MCAALVHRGPDDQGLYSSAAVTFGMRRLAIFDPANGHQPMIGPDGRFAIVFNGAIYNFRELRAELAKNWEFRTQCDTEVLLAAFARWGEDCLGKLRGMFAFAVWDTREQTLFLARDPFGIKPLYFRQDGGALQFASELNALRAGVGSFEIDPAAIADYLGWFAVPAPRTIYRGVRSLRPGESGLWRAGRFILDRSWTFRSIPGDVSVCRTRSAFQGELRERLGDSIRAHALADVPVGAFLSGGLDSAVVVGLMSRQMSVPLRTFSVGFEESDYSEAEPAAATARHFGTDHRTFVLTGRQVAQDIERILGEFDQPTGDGLNTYYVSAAARAGGVTAALSGLGGDELFGGYPSFRDLPRLARLLPWWRALPRFVRRPLLRPLRRGGTRRRKLADFLNYARDAHQLAALQRRVFSEPRRRELLSAAADSVVSSLSPFHPELESLANDLMGAGPLELAEAWELRTYMVDVLLRDSDVMSMRHSLELRVPFVDRPLIEWLWRQPTQFRFTPGQPKSALAHAVGDLLPPDLAARRKRGFALPMDGWMRTDLRPFLEETFSTASLDRARYFDRKAAQAAWRDFIQGDDRREWSRVWSLAVAIAFANRRGASLGAPRSSAATIKSADSRPRHRRPPSLLVAPEIFESAGGIQRMLQLYLRALAEIGEAENRGVRLLALNDSVLDSGDVRRCAGGRLDDWAVCDGSKRRFVREALRLSRGCDRLVCGHVAQAPVAWLAARLNRRLRYFVVAHGIEVWRPFSSLEKRALRGAARVFCVSEFTRRELLKRVELPSGRAVLVPNALDPAFAIAAGAPLDQCPPVILTVSRLSAEDRYKGIDHLIAALPAVLARVPGATLRVVGRGDDLGRLQGLVRRDSSLAGCVNFLGFLTQSELSKELRQCRLFALPSTREGFGLVYLEAMAHGRPCVGAEAAASPEIVTPETGLLAAPDNVDSIAAALIEGLSRPWREEPILERARAYSFERFRDVLQAALDSAAVAC
jgi:asparagine synthase (glutamine-hydrolysing)